jgi:tRNA modification GTPase
VIYETENVIYISALEDKNIDKLKEKIKQIYQLEQIETDDMTYLSNARSISLVKEAKQAIDNAKEGINSNIPIDMVEIDVKKAWDLLGEIIGKTYQEELINQLFSQFCLGK